MPAPKRTPVIGKPYSYQLTQSYGSDVADRDYVLVLDNTTLNLLRYGIDKHGQQFENDPTLYDVFGAVLKLPNIKGAITTNTISRWEHEHVIACPNKMHGLYGQYPKHLRVLTHYARDAHIPLLDTPSGNHFFSMPPATRKRLETYGDMENAEQFSKTHPHFFAAADAGMPLSDALTTLPRDGNPHILTYPTSHDFRIYKTLVDNARGHWDTEGRLWFSDDFLRRNHLVGNNIGEQSLCELVNGLEAGCNVIIVSDDAHAFTAYRPHDIKLLRSKDGFPVSLISTRTLLESGHKQPIIREQTGLENVPYLDLNPDQHAKYLPHWQLIDYTPNDPYRVPFKDVVALGIERQKVLDAIAAQKAEAARKQLEHEESVRRMLASNTNGWVVKTNQHKGGASSSIKLG